MRLIRPFAAVCLMAGGLLACGSETTNPPEPVPTSLALSASSVNFTALGATEQVGAVVRDQNDQPITGATVTFASGNLGVATVSPTGLITAVANGSTNVTVTHGSLSGQIAVSVAQVVTEVVKSAGDMQTGEVATELGTALEVQLRDARGNAVPGGVVPNTTVQFATDDGGSVSTPSIMADGNGRASTTWTLGSAAGTQLLTASVQGGTASATFLATATAAAADTLALVSGDGQTGQINAALPDSLVVRVADAFGNPVSGHAVTFSATGGGGSVSPVTVNTGTNGQAATEWTLGSSVGGQTAQADAETSISGSPVSFSTTATNPMASSVAVFDGDGQTGLVDAPVNIAPAVLVQDQLGDPFAGATVTFAVQSGGGSVTDAVAVTDAEGVAQVGSWTLGSAAGANTLSATVTGAGISGNPVTFNATGGTAQFNLEVRFFGPNAPTATQQAAFDAAEAMWEDVIFGDLTDIPVNQPQGQACFMGPADLPPINETVDDLVIFAKVDSIDGPGAVLGQARPCLIRNSNALPVVGLMFFDKDDLATLEANGTLSLVVLHEMGHVLGFGPLWNQNPLSLMASACPSPTNCTTDPHFVGPRAIGAFDQIGGTAYTAGEKVPLEDCVTTPGPCGAGTVNSHWRESVFGTELMTGYVGTSAPFSVLTIASFLDMAYQVNYSAADPYTWPTPPPGVALVGAGPLIQMKDDIDRRPIQVLDATGRVVRIVRR